MGRSGEHDNIWYGHILRVHRDICVAVPPAGLCEEVRLEFLGPSCSLERIKGTGTLEWEDWPPELLSTGSFLYWEQLEEREREKKNPYK